MNKDKHFPESQFMSSKSKKRSNGEKDGIQMENMNKAKKFFNPPNCKRPTNQCKGLTRGPSNMISKFSEEFSQSEFFPMRTNPGGMKYKSIPDNIGSAARFIRQGCLSFS